MSLSLLLDLYELTMVAGYVREGMQDRPAVFDLYFRKNPFQGGYAIFAGLEPALEYLEGLRFDEADLDYIDGLGLFDSGFLTYLKEFRFEGRVTSVPEGEVVFGGEPLLTVEGSLGQAQMIETAMLNLINFQTLIATKAARVAGAAGEAGVVEFGARRGQGPDGALSASRAAVIGGVRRTSHLRAGKLFDIGVSGTQAHSWVMAFPTELESFRAYAEAFPDDCVLLVDTYDTLRSGVPNAIKVASQMRQAGRRLVGVRLDSGDLAFLSRKTREMLDDAGFPDVKIIASNELDEHVIASVRQEGGCVDVYGVGTRLVTGWGRGGGALGGVYKLVELDGVPRIKVSADEAKSTIPARKRLWRVSTNGEDPRYQLDVMAGIEETPQPADVVFDPFNPLHSTLIPSRARIEDLRSTVMEQGRRTRPAPDLDSLAARVRRHLDRLPDGCRRLLNPHIYRVSLGRKLHESRQEMIESARTGFRESESRGGGEKE